MLDEYDTPIVEAYNEGYYNEIMKFMRSLFNASFKDNRNMYRAILTGITRVSKESLFSDFNNPKICGMLNNEYSEYFGFTEKEVFELLDEYGLNNQKEEIKYWYDGFTVGSQKNIYNPWSILNYLDTKVIDSYWTHTSSNILVNKLIQHGSSSVKMNFEKLLSGETFKTKINELITFNRLESNANNIYSLLLVSGYLRIVSKDKDKYELDITNHEVRIMFEEMIENWFKEDEDVEIIYNEFLTALFDGDIDYMNAVMNQIMEETFSYFDTSEKSQYPEKFYHGFVLGMMMNLRNNYIITNNRESGYGRYDVMLYSKEMDNGFILEFKVVNHMKNETLETAVNEALKQIEEKKYEIDLKARGVKKIHKYAFAFEKKKVLIKGL